MESLNHDYQADVFEAFNSTFRYLDDLLNIDNPYLEGIVNQIYPSELQPTPQILKPPFRIYIFLLQMDLFMINAMNFILI